MFNRFWERALGVALLLQVQVISCWPESTHSNSSSTLFTSTSSSTSSSIFATPRTFCGGCAIYYEVHGHNWWPTVYTAYVATVVYTVDNGTGSTITSSVSLVPNATIYTSGINFTTYISSDMPHTTTVSGSVITTYSPLVGGVEFTTLDAEAAELVTLTQSNGITLDGGPNGYGFSTVHINNSLQGTAATACNYYYYNPSITALTPDSAISGLPATTYYTYTTVVEADKAWLWTTALPVGLDAFASYVATDLNLNVSACQHYGGGVGTLKVGVLTLTSYQTSYTSIEENSPPPTPTPTPQPNIPIATPQPNAPAPSPSPKPPQAAPTTAANPAPAATTPIPVQSPNPAPGQISGGSYTTTIISTATSFPPNGGPIFHTVAYTSILPINPNPNPSSYTTTIIQTFSSGGSLQTTTYITELPIGKVVSSSYGTTFVETYTSNGVLKTTSLTTTVPVGLVISSLFGGGGAATTAPLQVTGMARSANVAGVWAWGLAFGVLVLVLN